MSPSVVAFVGLGSNLGASVGLLGNALRLLERLPDTSLAACSGFYRTPAWGVTEQPDFINAVAMLRTTLGPHALLQAMLDIERLAGRERGEAAGRWGPRTLDLDLLLYGDATVAAPDLRVPHPHLHERAFVLVPLAEIAPDACIPGHGRVGDALAAMAAGDIEALTYVSPPPVSAAS